MKRLKPATWFFRDPRVRSHLFPLALCLAALLLGAAFLFSSHSTWTASTTSLHTTSSPKSHPSPACPNPTHLGDEYGGWKICDGASLAGGLVYTIGVGKNIEWDKAMISRFKTKHHGWDPTPSARDFFAAKAPPPHFTFHPEGLGVRDGFVDVKLPVGNIDSYTIMKYDKATQEDKVVSIPVLSLDSMLKKNGHTDLAVLKIDVEGVEFEVIADWARREYRPPAKQILFEFHQRYFKAPEAKTLVPTAISQMASLGFELLITDHSEFTFVRRD